MADKKRKNKKSEGLRHTIQILWTVATNSYVTGFLQGKIYNGSLKKLCVPGLNCYSCPGALGSCPIGALQSLTGSREYKIGFYIMGFLMVVGALSGRFVCGWLCPFGLFQDLIYKIPFIKKVGSFKGDRILRYLKYVILVLFVILLPMVVVDVTGLGEPWFCKYICPQGALQAGIPLVILDSALRQTLGWLYTQKLLILAVIIILSLIIYRPFCKYICPLGAIYALFNKISAVSLSCDKEKCISCGKCARVCKMQVDPSKTPDHSECIRCGLCVSQCPEDALKLGVRFSRYSAEEKSREKENKS